MVFKHPVELDVRPEPHVIFAILVAIVYQRAGVLAHACPKAVAILVGSSVKPETVFLLQAGLVEQLLGPLEVVKLA